MELQKNALDYQRAVAFETVYREESTDCIVPDSQPDIERILDVCALSLIRDREAAQDEVKLRCTVRSVVLYTAADSDRVYSVEVPISYTHSVSMRGAEPGDELICTARTSSADARILNPRKLSVRVNTAYRVGAYRHSQEQIAFASAEDGCCVRTSRHTFSCRSALAAKNFTLVEDIDLDSAMPGAQRVYCTDFDISAQDIRLLAGRATVRAEAQVKALYESAEGKPCTIDHSFVFTQSADISTPDEENARAAASFSLRSFEIDSAVDMSGDSKYISLSAAVTMNIEAFEDKELEVLEDMYGLKREVQFVCRELALLPPGRSGSASARIREQIDTAEPAAAVLFSRIGYDGVFEKNEDELISTVSAEILYTGSDGAMYSASKRITLRFDAPGADPDSAAASFSRSTVTVSGGALNIEFDASVSFTASDGAPVSAVDTAQWGEAYPADERNLSAILTRAAQGESVWSVARRYHTTCEAIRQANPEVDFDAVPAPLILIPL